MPRQLRIQYEGAIYHLMSRGDRREEIFRDDVDRKRFLEALEAVCQKRTDPIFPIFKIIMNVLTTSDWKR
jgi:REP element-mobilizing transposase RayT